MLRRLSELLLPHFRVKSLASRLRPHTSGRKRYASKVVRTAVAPLPGEEPASPAGARSAPYRASRSGPEGVRTLDLVNAIHALSQLSYRPVRCAAGGDSKGPPPLFQRAAWSCSVRGDAGGSWRGRRRSSIRIAAKAARSRVAIRNTAVQLVASAMRALGSSARGRMPLM